MDSDNLMDTDPEKIREYKVVKSKQVMSKYYEFPSPQKASFESFFLSELVSDAQQAPSPIQFMFNIPNHSTHVVRNDIIRESSYCGAMLGIKHAMDYYRIPLGFKELLNPELVDNDFLKETSLASTINHILDKEAVECIKDKNRTFMEGYRASLNSLL